ncbi:hypothetical protein JW979_13505 [bacterium]|nr:hypothetical protein [candidate division CSSED10-310 bacterium]
MNRAQHIRTESVIFLIITAATSILFLPLIDQRFFWSHDEAQLLWRITELHANVQAGQPFCRWFPDFARGLGLPFLEFFPVLFLCLCEIFKIFNLQTILSAKIVIVIITLFGSYSAYLLALCFWNRRAAIFSAVLYSYAPYRIVNLYVRGDVNEFTGMALLPFNLWLITKYSKSEHTIFIRIPLIMGIAAILTTHFPTIVIQLPIYCLWAVMMSFSAKKSWRFLLMVAVSIIIALILASPIWANAFFNRHLVQMEGMTKGFANYSDQFIHPGQWFDTYWNYGASVKGTGDTLSFQIGNCALIAIITGFPIWRRRLYIRNEKNIWPLIIVLFLSLFLTSPFSKFLWESIPILPLLQFPYRLLQIPALVLSVWGGAFVMVMETYLKKKTRWLFPVSVGVILTCSSYMCRAGAYLNISEKQLTPETVRRISHTHCTGEFLPKAAGDKFPPKSKEIFKVKKIPEEGFSRHQMEITVAEWLQNASKVDYWKGNKIQLGSVNVVPGSIEIISGNGSISSGSGPLTNRTFSINAQDLLNIRWAQFYFQGWECRLNNVIWEITPDPETGLISLAVPKGEYEIVLQYRNLPMSRALYPVSILILLGLMVWSVYIRVRQNCKF